MKLDQLRHVEELKIIFDIVKANDILLPQQNVKTDTITLTLNNIDTYGIFLIAGNDSSTNGTTTTALTAQISLVIFTPRNTQLNLPYSFSRSNFIADTTKYPTETSTLIFGNAGDLSCYSMNVGYQSCTKIGTVITTPTLYPNITKSDISGTNANILFNSFQLNAVQNPNGYYFPFFVDINITRDFTNGNIFTDLQNLKPDYEFNIINDVNLITGQLSVLPVLSGDTSGYLRFAGNQWFSSFLTKILNSSQPVSYFPYIYPEVNYIVKVDYNSNIITFSYTILHPNNILFPTSIAFIIIKNNKKLQKVIFPNTQAIAGTTELLLSDFVTDNFCEIQPVIYYNNEYIGKTKFVVAYDYDTSIELAPSINILTDPESLPTATLNITYIKKKLNGDTPYRACR